MLNKKTPPKDETLRTALEMIVPLQYTTNGRRMQDVYLRGLQSNV